MDQVRPKRRILLAGDAFDGPYPSPDDLEDRPGVWAVLEKEAGAVWRPVDVGRSETGRPRYRRPPSRGSDDRGELGFAVSYADTERSRALIEGHVRTRYRLGQR